MVLTNRAYIFNEENKNNKLIRDEIYIITISLKNKKKNYNEEINYKYVSSLKKKENNKVSRLKARYITIIIKKRIYLFKNKEDNK